ncbi:MAG: hypothetical protein KBA11_05900 [Sedimentibacter sp.]|nr:hypothetical protein [Sedimentibacter sp.]
MEILDLLFALVQSLVPIPESKYRSLYGEALEWRAKIEAKSKDNFEELTSIDKVYLKVHKPWGVRLLIAIFYIPIFRWLNAPPEPDRDDE